MSIQVSRSGDDHFAVLMIQLHAGSGLSAQHGPGHGVLQVFLDQAFEGPSAELGIVAGGGDVVHQGLRPAEFDAFFPHAAGQLGQLDLHDLADVGLAEAVEDDDVVQAVQEFRPEILLEGAQQPGPEGFEVAGLIDLLRADVITVWRKSTVRPLPSVKRPSSRICSRTLNTSGCAFSISSKRITL